MRRTSSILAFGVFLLGVEARADKDRYDPGEMVPTFSLKAVNPDDSGESYVSLDKYVGPDAKTPKKAVLLSFFATYCEPCKKEMPFLAALYEIYKDKGLQILSVSIDKEPDKIDFAKSLAKDKGVRFPVLSDRFNIVAKRYFIEKLPNVYVLNGEGKVALVKVGYTGDVTRQLLEEVRKSVGEPASDPVPATLQTYLAAHEEAGSAAANPAAVAAEEAPAKGKKAKGKKGKGKAK